MVGRKRKDGNPLGLEPRVEWHHGQFRYRHPDGRKEGLGTDIHRANQRARLIRSGSGTVFFWVGEFIAAAKAKRLPAGWELAERTIEDYEREADFIGCSPLGGMDPVDAARDVSVFGEYRDNRVSEAGKGRVQANHSLALLASTYSWLLETGKVRGLTGNPMGAVSRFPRKPKDRYVEDSEYRPVYGIAQRSVCMAMGLVHATLQRPGDILSLPANPVRLKAVAGSERRVIGIRQGKTSRTVDIEVTPELDDILGMLRNPADRVVKLPQALVHGLDGSAYTEDGLAAMLRRYCLKAGVKSFGLMDIRAKGATDMYLRGVPLEVIQALMGHASVKTTEIYIKRMLATVSTVRPNSIGVANG